MIGVEVFQGVYGGHGTFIGTFDGADVICYIIGYIAASVSGYLIWTRNSKERVIENGDEVLKKERKRILIIIVVFIILGFFPALVT